MKKSSKRLTISSEALNDKGFRVRTTGIDLAEFRQNPLLLWMHKRPTGEHKDEILPLGYWEDIEEKDGRISGVPVFDDTDDFAMRIYNKVENGTIKMGSAGLLPQEFADVQGDLWLEKSLLREGSLVDIGSNKECLSVALYDTEDKLVTLAEVYDKNPKTITTMKLIQLSASTVALLKLSEGATEADAHKAILELITLSDTQKSTIDKLKADKEAAEQSLADQVKLSGSEKLNALVDKAEEDRKITADQKAHYLKLGAADFDSTKALLDSMKGAPAVAGQLNTGATSSEALMKLSWDELDAADKLVTLKAENPEGFKAKFKERFGKEPTE